MITPLLLAARGRIQNTYRPSTQRAYMLHFRTFLSFVIAYKLDITLSLPNVLAFLEFLSQNSLSHKVISNYISSLKFMATKYNLPKEQLSHKDITLFIRSLTINSKFRPTPRGVFDITTLISISQLCEGLEDPVLVRAAFLLSFFAFLCMSNVAPHSRRAFDPNKHLLRQDVVFGPPGAHIILKWTKTLQDSRAHHIVQIPSLPHSPACPVSAIQALLHSRKFPSDYPLL